MATIRIPKELKPLLPLCRSYTGPRPDDNKNAAPFDTFADLMVFAAAAGFHNLHGVPPKNKAKDFLDQPNPIDFSVFKSSEARHPVLLLIALAASKDKDIVRDEDLICRLTEDFAKVGAAVPSDILVLADRLVQTNTFGSPRL